MFRQQQVVGNWQRARRHGHSSDGVEAALRLPGRHSGDDEECALALAMALNDEALAGTSLAWA